MTSLLVAHAPRSAAEVRHAVLRELRRRGLPDRVVDDALLVVSELVGNAVRHGRPLAEGGVRVSWHVDEGALRLEVCDGGPGLPPPDAAAPPADPAERLGTRHGDFAPVPVGAEGGRGLPIVETLCERWGSTATPGPPRAAAVFAELSLTGTS